MHCEMPYCDVRGIVRPPAEKMGLTINPGIGRAYGYYSNCHVIGAGRAGDVGEEICTADSGSEYT